MRLISVLVAVFLLAAFAIGVSLEEEAMPEINIILNNASEIVSNFSIEANTSNPYIDGSYRVGEKFVQFAIVSGVEVMRMGILFGHDNPDYFTPDFIIGIAKILILAMIISALFIPMLYLLAFFAMLLIWIKNKIKKRRKKHGKKTN